MWRYTFLHPAARTVFDDWQGQLRGCVRHLRALSGLEPDAPDLAAIVGELVLKSPEFAKLWDRYDVAGHSRRTKTFHHPEVGDLSLGYDMQLNGTPGQTLIAYWATPRQPRARQHSLARPRHHRPAVTDGYVSVDAAMLHQHRTAIRDRAVVDQDGQRLAAITVVSRA